ncbi:MAG: D-alanine--D-serine ligase VanG [Fastidiosipilaceae bacterium]|jgi:D-alanine---D-serine ligase
MNRLNIAVLFGGHSPEYSVSLQSAHSVLSHMDEERFRPFMIGITKDGNWFHFTGDPDKIPADTWHNPTDCVPAVISPSRDTHGMLILRPSGVETVRVDVAFPVLHGKFGEDGTLQGLLEMAGIPIVGCKTLSSALCMDKDRANLLTELAGVSVPRTVVLNKGVDDETALKEVERIGFPVFVKPVKAGSSYGVTSVTDKKDLPDAIHTAFKYDNRVMAQQTIVGIEVGCAVLGNERLIVGAVDEVELTDGFFDFTEKYTHKSSAIHVPARISESKAAEVQAAAKTIYTALDCSGMARVDVFLTPSGEIVFNEVNTIPGFTAMSRYPGMMDAAGIPFAELVTRLIELALECE